MSVPNLSALPDLEAALTEDGHYILGDRHCTAHEWAKALGHGVVVLRPVRWIDHKRADDHS